MTEEDVEHLRKVRDQIWVEVVRTNSAQLLVAHQELSDSIKRITGEED